MTDHETCPNCTSWWRLPLLLAIVLAGIMFLLRGGALGPAPQADRTPRENVAAAPNATSVQLTINFGDGRAPMSAESRWQEGMTVADLLNSDPRISVASTGSGAGEFLNSLNGVANEGVNGRNWTYRVNGKHADRSYAVYELRPGDRVLWMFAAQQ
jgi:Domain of unknown function (DUF4430)